MRKSAVGWVLIVCLGTYFLIRQTSPTIVKVSGMAAGEDMGNVLPLADVENSLLRELDRLLQEDPNASHLEVKIGYSVSGKHILKFDRHTGTLRHTDITKIPQVWRTYHNANAQRIHEVVQKNGSLKMLDNAPRTTVKNEHD